MALSNDIQWGRYAEAIFTNFDSGLVSTIKSAEISGQDIIGDGLRIVFDYTKQRDEVTAQSNGKIVIYGLTEKTFSAVGERLRCEIELKAGYIKSKSNAPQRIFKAILMDKKHEVQGDITVSTFTVWGDFQHKYVGQQKKMSQTLPAPYFVDVVDKISQAMSLEGWAARLDGTDDEVANQTEYLMKLRIASFGYAMSGTPQQELKKLRDGFGIGYQIQNKMLVFHIIDEARDYIINRGQQLRTGALKPKTDTSIVAGNKSPAGTTESTPNPTAKINIFKTHAIVLDDDNGLIGSPIFKTVVENVGYGDALQNNEEIWQKKEQRVLLDKEGKPKIDKKTGKEKMSKQPKYKKVARRNVIAKCFINGAIDYNAMVQLQSHTGITDGLYRTRKIQISGDTEVGDWYMELELNET